MIKYVLGFLFSEDRKRVLLMHKRRPSWQRGRLNGCGGHIEPGEVASAAMNRESMEEIGVTPEWTHAGDLIGPNWSCAVFKAFSDHAMRNSCTRTDERVEQWTVLGLSRSKLPLPNVRSLVALCFCDEPDMKFLLQYAEPVAVRPASAVLLETLESIANWNDEMCGWLDAGVRARGVAKAAVQQYLGATVELPAVYTAVPVYPIESRQVPLDVARGGENVTDYLDLCIEVSDWCGGTSHMMNDEALKNHIKVPDPSGEPSIAYPGQYIVKMSDGSFLIGDQDPHPQILWHAANNTTQ